MVGRRPCHRACLVAVVGCSVHPVAPLRAAVPCAAMDVCARSWKWARRAFPWSHSPGCDSPVKHKFFWWVGWWVGSYLKLISLGRWRSMFPPQTFRASISPVAVDQAHQLDQAHALDLAHGQLHRPGWRSGAPARPSAPARPRAGPRTRPGAWLVPPGRPVLCALSDACTLCRKWARGSPFWNHPMRRTCG